VKRLELQEVRICKKCGRGRALLLSDDDESLSVPLDPVRALKETITSLEEQVNTRVTSVENGRKYLAGGGRTVDIPDGAAIFETTGAWEDFATPSRDLRLLIAIDVVRGVPDRVARRPFHECAIRIHFEPPRPERHRLIQANTLADHGRLADDDAGSVIDEAAAADPGARVDVHAGGRVRHLRDHARDERGPQLVQGVRQPVIGDRLHTGIADQDLLDAPGRRIAAVRGNDVGLEQRADGRKRREKARGDLHGVTVHVRIAIARAPGVPLELVPHLLDQSLDRAPQRLTDERVDIGAIDVRRAEVRGEQRADDTLQRGGERPHGWQCPRGRAVGVVRAGARAAQRGDDMIELRRQTGRRT